MRKLSFLLLLMTLAFSVNAQKSPKYFPDDQLITTGVYYYPEHWDPSQWERPFPRSAESLRCNPLSQPSCPERNLSRVFGDHC